MRLWQALKFGLCVVWVYCQTGVWVSCVVWCGCIMLSDCGVHGVCVSVSSCKIVV